MVKKIDPKDYEAAFLFTHFVNTCHRKNRMRTMPGYYRRPDVLYDRNTFYFYKERGGDLEMHRRHMNIMTGDRRIDNSIKAEDIDRRVREYENHLDRRRLGQDRLREDRLRQDRLRQDRLREDRLRPDRLGKVDRMRQEAKERQEARLGNPIDRRVRQEARLGQENKMDQETKVRQPNDRCKRNEQEDNSKNNECGHTTPISIEERKNSNKSIEERKNKTIEERKNSNKSQNEGKIENQKDNCLYRPKDDCFQSNTRLHHNQKVPFTSSFDKINIDIKLNMDDATLHENFSNFQPFKKSIKIQAMNKEKPPGESPQKTGGFGCVYCNEKFYTKVELIKHLHKYHAIIQ